MGNVLATSKPITDGSSLGGLPELSKESIDLSSPHQNDKKAGGGGGITTQQHTEDRENPGTMDELHKRCKGKFDMFIPL